MFGTDNHKIRDIVLKILGFGFVIFLIFNLHSTRPPTQSQEFVPCFDFSEANLPYSHDGKLVAEVGVENDEQALIIKTRSDGTVIRQIDNQYKVEKKFVEEKPLYLNGFFSPRFSIDDKKVYFMTTLAVTSNVVCELDVATGRVRFMTAGNTLLVVPIGKYEGKLIVQQHNYFLDSGSYDWYWIIDPNTGERVENSPINSLEDFFDIWVCSHDK